MMKFFRRYMRHLLAVFMALLLIVWLGDRALTEALSGGQGGMNEVRGTVYGREVTLGDIMATNQDAEILQGLGVLWSYPWFYAVRGLSWADQSVQYQLLQQMGRAELNGLEWYLLDTAARQAGIEVSDEALTRFKTTVGINGERMDAVRRQYSVSLARIDQALRTMLRILNLVDVAGMAVKPSEADVQAHIRRANEQADIEAVVLEVSKYIDSTYQPTAEELQAQFDKWKDQDPQPGSLKAFGYRLPARAQVEFIRISATELMAKQNISEDDAFSYWEANKASFLAPATQPTTGTAPAEPPQPQPYETFLEARAEVIERLQRERAQQEAVRLAREMISRLQQPWANAATTQPGDFKIIPEGQQAEDVYPKLIEQFEARFAGALRYGRSGMFTQAEAGSQPDIGSAAIRIGQGGMIGFGQLAFLVAGLDAEVDAKSDQARFLRNIHETVAEPLLDTEGNAFVLRTVAAEPKRVPAGPAEVGEKVAADVRLLRAYEQARQDAESLLALAKDVGLKPAFDADEALRSKVGQDAYKDPGPFPRVRMFSFGGQSQSFPSSVPGIGGGELVDLCFAMASQAATQPVQPRLHEDDARRRFIVVQFQKLLPITEQEYRDARADAFNAVRMERWTSFVSGWFSPEQIEARVEWKPAQPAQAEPGADEAEDGGPAKPASSS